MTRRTNTAGRLSGTLAEASPEEGSATHSARKALFARALAQGFLSRQEIDDALPPGALTDSERWLLHYSLRAANIEVRDSAAPKPRTRGKTRPDRPSAASKSARRP